MCVLENKGFSVKRCYSDIQRNLFLSGSWVFRAPDTTILLIDVAIETDDSLPISQDGFSMKFLEQILSISMRGWGLYCSIIYYWSRF